MAVCSIWTVQLSRARTYSNHGAETECLWWATEPPFRHRVLVVGYAVSPVELKRWTRWVDYIARPHACRHGTAVLCGEGFKRCRFLSRGEKAVCRLSRTLYPYGIRTQVKHPRHTQGPLLGPHARSVDLTRDGCGEVVPVSNSA